MNLSRSRQYIVTRRLRAQNGDLYDAQILVMESEAGIEFRIISAELVDAQIVKDNALSLSSGRPTFSYELSDVRPARSIPSTFTSDFAFFNSQPTRAPSVK